MPERITPDTPLTDLGLDSLMAVRLRAAVEREFGAAPSTGDLMRADTVQAAADAITRVAQHDWQHGLLESPVTPIVASPADRRMPYPCVPCARAATARH